MLTGLLMAVVGFLALTGGILNRDVVSVVLGTAIAALGLWLTLDDEELPPEDPDRPAGRTF